MKRKMMPILSCIIVLSFTGCAEINQSSVSSTDGNLEQTETLTYGASSQNQSSTGTVKTSVTDQTDSKDSSEYFTERDLKQEADLSEAVYISVDTAEEITITEAGVYVFTGKASNKTIIVDAGDEDKVQLVLSDLSITNENSPCIYVKNADKVFVTSTGSNTLTVTGTFEADEDTNTDAVIFSKDDLVLNGTGTLVLNSSYNGVTSKDTVKVTGGTYEMTVANHGIEAHDAILLADGNITINAQSDGIHSDDSEDDTIGLFYMAGGILNITAKDDGIHAITTATVDGGTITVSAAEGIEATIVTINDGTITISASDDGINGAKKSSLYTTPLVEINGGYLTIKMGAGDTDGIDSNGDLVINGGTVDITGQSPFDYDGTAQYNGGTLIVNGEETTSITNQMMGGRGQGGFGGQNNWGTQGGFGGQGTQRNQGNGGTQGTQGGFGNGWN